ncbi:hypothetical protein GJ496_001977 [Pomphorhynchus laevis]|nr:hypothetical protein GJ496_001977 [Pomphorhynchus laevis]
MNTGIVPLAKDDLAKTDTVYKSYSTREMETMTVNARVTGASAWLDLTIEQLLDGLITYFQHPDPSLEHEIRQKNIKVLRRRQDISQEEGMINVLISMINFVSETFDKSQVLDIFDSRIEKLTNQLYCVLAAIIFGNRNNCKQFAQGGRLNWLVNKLLSQNASTGVLEVINNVLLESPEVLNMITEYHIRAIIGLLDRNGRDSKVLDVLGSLCRNQNVAVRTNQNLICDTLIPQQSLLIKTVFVDQMVSMRPNIAVKVEPNYTMHDKFYFEVIVDHIDKVSHQKPVLRVGWAKLESQFAPGIGHSGRSVGAGDDSYSWAFDGLQLWHGISTF